MVSSQVLADPPDRKEGRYKSAADVEQNGIGGVVEAMTTKFTSDPTPTNFCTKIHGGAKTSRIYWCAQSDGGETGLYLSAFPLSHFLIVLIHGDADMLIPVERAREVKAAIPNAYLAEISGAGHMPMMEAKEKTAEALEHFAK